MAFEDDVLTTCSRLGAFVVLCVAASQMAGQQVKSYRTTADLSSTLAAQPVLRFGTDAAAKEPLTIEVDETKRFQTMDGFGASLTDGSAWLLHDKLTPALRKKVMAQLFDPQRGIGLSFLRQPIGSTDLSRDASSFDDMPKGERDPELKRFSIKHDEPYVLPIVLEALKLNPEMTVMATAWSAPGWMKTRDTMFGGALREDAMPVYARYLARSVAAYEKAGVPIKYLTVQNEPLHETEDFPGTLMEASQAKRLIGEYVGPELQKVAPRTKVLAYDHNWDHPEYALAVLQDAKAAPYMAGSALHCYGGDVTAQSAIHEQMPEKGVWLTECSGGTWQKESPLLATAHLMIDTTRNWAKSVVLWGVALDTMHEPHAGGCGTCRGLVTVDLGKTPAAVSYTGDYYALGQASKFVRPGAARIASTSFGREGLETVAFENRDGRIALLVLNNGAAAKRFSVRWQGKRFAVTAAAGAFATYTWKTAR